MILHLYSSLLPIILPSQQLVDRLSVPASKTPSKLDIKLDPTLRYGTLSDAKNCRFRPITVAGVRRKKLAAQQAQNGSSTGASDDNNRKEDPKFNFINRQEAEERARREDLLFEMGKRDYDALVDKKRCPKCGAKKSYDEVREKKKICPNCKVEYCYAVDWAKISRQFFKKEYSYQRRSQEVRQTLERDLEQERTGGRSMEGGKTLTPEEEQDFFDRMAERLQRRKEKMDKLASEMYEQPCTFQPSTNSGTLSSRSGSRIRSGRDNSVYEEEDDWEYDEDGRLKRFDPVQDFNNRFEQDLQYRKEKFPEKFVRSYK